MASRLSMSQDEQAVLTIRIKPTTTTATTKTPPTTRSRIQISHETLLKLQRITNPKRKTSLIHNPCIIRTNDGDLSVMGVVWPMTQNTRDGNSTSVLSQQENYTNSSNHQIELDPVVFLFPRKYSDDSSYETMIEKMNRFSMNSSSNSSSDRSTMVVHLKDDIQLIHVDRILNATDVCLSLVSTSGDDEDDSSRMSSEWMEWLRLELHDIMVVVVNNSQQEQQCCFIRLNDQCIFELKSVSCAHHRNNDTSNSGSKRKQNTLPNTAAATNSCVYRITRDTKITIVNNENMEKKRNKRVEQEQITHISSESLKAINDKKLLTSATKELFSLMEAACSISDMRLRYSVLIHGPSAVGKTFGVKLCAQILHIPLIYVNQITSSLEKSIVTNVQKTLKQKNRDTVILFIDDLQQQQNDSLVVAHWEKLHAAFNSLLCKVVIVGAASTDTKNNESGRSTVQISSVLRGKFQREVAFSYPSQAERSDYCTEQLQELFQENKKQIDVDLLFSKLGEWTIGYNMGSLNQLAQTIKNIVSPMLTDNENTKTSIMNMIHSLAQKGSSSLSAKWIHASSDNAQVGDRIEEEKNVWNEIGGLYDIKEKLQQSAQWPMMYPESFKRLGLEPPRGILLYGPPGCAKTTLVRVLAKATHSTFIYCNVAQIYSPYVGEAEASVRRVFTEARIMSPSIVFLDEIDALVGKRFDKGTPNASSSGVESRILSTLLNEMDGVEQAKQVLVIAATNRPDMIDNALMRPGRLDHILYVPPPDEDSRRSILEIHTRKLPVTNRTEVIEQLVNNTSMTGDMTGAELEALCREACMVSMRKFFNGDASPNMDDFAIDYEHFIEARNRVTPVLRKHPEMLESYVRFERDFYNRK